MTQATFEATVEGAGDLPNIDLNIDAITNATLRHSALSNVDVDVTGVSADIRQYATFFAPFELRVAFPKDDSRAPERVFKGQLVEVEQSAGSAVTTLKTVGRLIKLEKTDGFREFADIRAFEALRTYINEETPFDADVRDDPGTTVVDDGVAVDLSTQSDYADFLNGEIPADQPFEFVNGELRTVDTCFIDDLAGTSNPDFSGGEGYRFSSRVQEIYLNINLDYECSSIDFYAIGQDTDTSDDTILEVYYNGNFQGSVTYPEAPDLAWSSTSIDATLGPGDETIILRPNQDLTYGATEIDIMAAVDSRFSYTFDDVALSTVSRDYRDGPETKPDSAQLEWPIIDQETQVSACRINSTWDDTSGNQQLAASPNGGTDYLTADNSETLDVDFEAQDIIGTDLRIRTTHDRHSPDGARQQTPRYGYASQSISDIEVRFDQISVAIIGPSGTLFAENHLQNIKDLASLARYNFVVDHAGDADAIDAFPVGFENPDGVEWMPIGWARRDGDPDYANRVVARGATKPESERESADDLRYEAAVRDDDEIDRLTDLGLTEEEAIQTTVVTDPELSSADEVQAQAYNELESVVGNRLPSGSIDIVPTFIPPGYAYAVEEFETLDGDVPSRVLEKVSYSEGYGQDATGSLEFKTPRNWVSGLTPVEKDVIGIKRLF